MKGAASCEARETNPAPPGDDEGSQGREEQRNPVPPQQRRPGGATKRLYGPGWSLWAAPWRRKPGRASWALPAARAQGRGVIRSLRSRPSRAMGHEVFVSRSEASFGSASRDAVAGHSCVVERHGVLRPPTRQGQSVARPRRRSGGHDIKRPRVWWCPERVTPPRWPSSGSVRPGGRRRRG